MQKGRSDKVDLSGALGGVFYSRTASHLSDTITYCMEVTVNRQSDKLWHRFSCAILPKNFGASEAGFSVISL